MKKVLLAGLFHEGNSFSSLITGESSFAVTRGEAVLAKARISNAGLGGAFRYLDKQPVTLLPVATAIAPPGGPVDDGFYARIRSEIVDTAQAVKPDGIYLDLHGAMITQTLDDPEGDLLSTLRKVVGPDVPIAANLDLHAYVTETMLRSADIIVACKENPHTDYAEAGAKAAELLLRLLDGAIKPMTAAIWLPLIIGARMETGDGPLARLHIRRRELIDRTSNLLDISIYNTTTLVDAPNGGQCITAIADNDPDAACEAVETLARAFWDVRDEFTHELPSLASVISDLKACVIAPPVILGDQGDRVLAGTPGDGTAVLRELLTDWPDVRALVPVTDPDAVRVASDVGVGGTMSCAVGGRFSEGVTPVEADWHVLALGDGKFVQEGPFLAGEPAVLGDTALLRTGKITVLATSLPGLTQDPEAFRSQGADPAEFDVVVTKSGHHFKLSFAKTGRCIVIDTPGISNYRAGIVPFQKRRPIYPEDTVDMSDVESIVF